MAKRYDPILCMMVDEPTKAHDGILFYQLRFSSGRTEGAKLDESEIRSYAEALLEKYGEKQVVVSRQGKIVATYFNRKVRDVAPATQRYINTIVYESKANAEKFVRQAEQDDDVPENELKYVYKAYNEKFGYKFHDSASTLDKAIKTADGMFQQIFAGKLEMQIRNDLTRIDEAYNTAGNDCYAARREIQETMDSLTQVMLRKAREKRK